MHFILLAFLLNVQTGNLSGYERVGAPFDTPEAMRQGSDGSADPEGGQRGREGIYLRARGSIARGNDLIMAWSSSYSYRVLIALDQLAAAIFFNRDDICVSSLCRIVQNADAGIGDFPARLASLSLKPWQIDFLRWLAPKLDKIEAGHCELSRQGDLARAESAKTLLS